MELKIVSSLTLLLCFLAALRPGCGSFYDDDDLGSGGSGDGSIGDNEPDCRLPNPRPPSPPALEDEVLTEIRCHVACIERIRRDSPVDFDESPGFGVWPNTPDSSLERNCGIYNQVQECRVGCVTRSKLSPERSVRKCRTKCFRNCVADCYYLESCDQGGTRCPRICDKAFCERGCQVYTEDIANSGGVLGRGPPMPIDPPILNISVGSQIAGRYLVDVSHTAPAPVNNPSTTNFLFRVTNIDIEFGTETFGLYWLRSLDEPLNLEAFACEEDVTVQFAAVNKYGRSDYSPGTGLSVYGESRPHFAEHPDPYSLRFQIQPDERFGFWKHAVIHVSWRRPRGFPYLLNYEVTLFPSLATALCGSGRRDIVVQRNRTTAVIRAADMPTQGPVDGCRYSIAVKSVSEEPLPLPPIVDVYVSVTNPVPLDLRCIRRWDPERGQFKFNMLWTVPDSSYLHNAISHFGILTEAVVNGESIPTGIPGQIPFDASRSFYIYTTEWVDALDVPGNFYKLTLTTHAISHDLRILIPEPRTCTTYDAQGLPAEPIQEITVMVDVVDETDQELVITVNVNWTAPSGDINRYEIRIVELPDFGENVGEILYMNTFENLSRLTVSVRIDVPVELVQNNCTYLQLRSTNSFGVDSAWSRPVCISPPPPSPPPSPSPTVLSTKGGSELPRYFYILVAAGAVLLAAIAFMAVCVCLAYLQNKRLTRRREMIAAQASIRMRKKHSPTLPIARPRYQGGNPYSFMKADEWEIHPSQVIIESRLGEGTFGDVYMGTVRGVTSPSSSRPSPNGKKVTVKILKTIPTSGERENFLHHIQQTKRIAKTDSPYLINLIGCVTVHEPICLVAEYPVGGDLLTYLEKYRKQLVVRAGENQDEVGQPVPYMEPVGVYSSLEAPTVSLEPADLIMFASQVAAGMEHLASLGVVHGDLACRNVYLDSERNLRISDFSVSQPERGGEGVYTKTMTGRLPLRWMAVESITDGHFSFASDVWAFGITLWEIVTLGGFPYASIGNKDVLSTLRTGYRMECPENCSQEIYDIMRQCWSESPPERPSFRSLHQTFLTLLSSPNAAQLISLEVDESQSCYLRGTPHEKLHRSSANSTNQSARYTEITQALHHPYTDYKLPSIVEEGEESEQEENAGSEVLEEQNAIHNGKDEESSSGTIEL